jgi:hypothetical protein
VGAVNERFEPPMVLLTLRQPAADDREVVALVELHQWLGGRGLTKQRQANAGETKLKC